MLTGGMHHIKLPFSIQVLKNKLELQKLLIFKGKPSPLSGLANQISGVASVTTGPLLDTPNILIPSMLADGT